VKILVRVPNWLGDTMMASPAVTRLKKGVPGARVTVLCRPAFEAFWKASPGVDDVMVLGRFFDTVRALRERAFDAALVLPSSFSSALMVFLARIPKRMGFGMEGRGLLLTKAVDYSSRRSKHLVFEYMDLLAAAFDIRPKSGEKVALAAPVAKEAACEASGLLKSLKVKPGPGYIALGPGATFGPAKRWPAEYWRVLIERLLSERKEQLLVLGGVEEEGFLKALLSGFPENRLHLLAGRTSVPVLTALLSKCRLLVTNDTGPMHVAAAVGTPVVAVFGSTSSIWTRPWGTGHRVLSVAAPCSPCFQRKCNIGYPCLRGVTPEAVLDAIRNALKRRARAGGEPFPG